jgi:hypothetical protein
MLFSYPKESERLLDPTAAPHGHARFFEPHIKPFLTLKHAGDTDLQASSFLPELAVFFEGQVVVGVDLLEQDWFKFGWDQSWSARAFECGEVVQVLVELQGPVTAATQARGCWCGVEKVGLVWNCCATSPAGFLLSLTV